MNSALCLQSTWALNTNVTNTIIAVPEEEDDDAETTDSSLDRSFPTQPRCIRSIVI
jgi:hypothetical protein